MKRKKDPGLLYVQKLGISPAKTVEALTMSMQAKFGYERAKTYWDNLPTTGEDKNFFEQKNSDEEISYLFTGGHDADIIRQCANWIDSHKEAFGRSILEVGCDIGFMTGFLALTFPESRITAIDHSQNSINMAGKLMNKLGVTNVELICTELKDLDEDRQYDSVISMRCLNENLVTGGNDLDSPTYDMLSDDILNRFIPAITDYYSLLLSHLSYKGSLISITNAGPAPLTMSWMNTMVMTGLEINKDSYTKLYCKTPLRGGSLLIQAFYAVNIIDPEAIHENDGESQVNAEDVNIPSKESMISYLETSVWIAKNMVRDPSAAMFQGWEAEIMRENLAEDIIDGIALLDPKGKPIARFCLYSDSIDPTAVLSYAANDGGMTLAIYDISNLDQAKEEFRQIRELGVPEVNSLIKNNHCSMYPVIWVDGTEIIDMDQKIH